LLAWDGVCLFLCVFGRTYVAAFQLITINRHKRLPQQCKTEQAGYGLPVHQRLIGQLEVLFN
jgi:hypothetical protein